MKYIIDKNLPLPLYYQLKQVILNLIDENVYKENEAIPTEHELIKKYGLSRTTVRQALNELCNEGYIYRKKGVGTFVSTKKQQDEHHELLNPSVYKIDRVINRNGFVCKTKLLKYGTMNATPEIAAHLEVNVGDLVWYMDRVRYADIKAASFSRSYIRKDSLINFDKEVNKAAEHFYQYLDSKGLKIATIREKLVPVLATPEVREVLEIDNKTLILIVQDTGYKEDGTVVEYTVSTVDVSFIEMTATFKRR